MDKKLKVWLFLLSLFLIGCNRDRNYGIGEEIFHEKFEPLMENDIHMFVDHIYTYEGIEGGNIKIKYDYTEQYMGKTNAKAENISLPLNNNHEAILETKPVYPDERKGRKLILKIVDDQNRITMKPTERGN